MLVDAQLYTSTTTIATKLQSAQLEMWLSTGKSVDDVADLLKIGKKDNFGHPLLNTWVSYMDIIVKENPSKVSTLLSSLKTRLSEKSLMQVLEVIKKYPSLESTAAKSRSKTIQDILARNESPMNVFQLLALDNAGNAILSNPVFETWMEYVTTFNKKNPGQQEYWFEPLYVYHKSDGVEKMIENAIQNPSTVKIAKTVERAWFKQWLDNAKSPQYAFIFFHLDKTDENTPGNPNFKIWAKYLKDFNERYPDKDTSMINGLWDHYNGRALLRMFDVAKKNPDADTVKLATNLENALINKWLRDKVKAAQVRSWLSGGGVSGVDDMIERYDKRLSLVSETTS